MVCYAVLCHEPMSVGASYFWHDLTEAGWKNARQNLVQIFEHAEWPLVRGGRVGCGTLERYTTFFVPKHTWNLQLLEGTGQTPVDWGLLSSHWEWPRAVVWRRQWFDLKVLEHWLHLPSSLLQREFLFKNCRKYFNYRNIYNSTIRRSKKLSYEENLLKFKHNPCKT